MLRLQKSAPACYLFRTLLQHRLVYHHTGDTWPAAFNIGTNRRRDHSWCAGNWRQRILCLDHVVQMSYTMPVISYYLRMHS